jgi:hypothetical protein
MPIVVVPANLAARHIDFPESCERSTKGSIHIRPASTVDLTDEELAHIRKQYPDLAAKLIVANPGPSLEELLVRRAAQDKGARAASRSVEVAEQPKEEQVRSSSSRRKSNE